MKPVIVYTVIWSHEGAHCAMAGGLESMAHFRRQSAAEEFAKGKTLHGNPAEPFREEVPKRIASRWSIL